MATRKIARAATSGQFISIEEANRRPATSVIETVEVPSRSRTRRRRAVRTATMEMENDRPSDTGENT
jgi:hypothetical protein